MPVPVVNGFIVKNAMINFLDQGLFGGLGESEGEGVPFN